MRKHIDFASIDPEVVFTPKRRKLEYRFMIDQQIEISERRDLDRKEKEFMNGKLRKEYDDYNEKFDAYNRLSREYNMWTALATLNKRMGWPKKN